MYHLIFKDEDVSAYTTANAANSKEDVSNGHDVENEDEDIEFDPDELECVDEDADEERREREERIREERSHNERRKREEKRHHRLDARSRHSVERHHPYSRHERGDRRGFRSAREIGKADRRRIEPSRLRKPYDPKVRRVESYARKPQRRASADRGRRDRKDGDEKDIPLEELELEEVDCCDEVGDDGSEFTDGASGTSESHAGEDDDFDDVSMSRSRGPNHVSNVEDDDDFPDLCEELDEDAMRRAAAAAAAKNIVLSQQSPTRTISSPPPKSEEMASKPREASSSHRRDFDSRKIAAATPSRHSRSNRNGERNEDEARRRHHYSGRNEYRSRRDDRRHADERGRRDRTRERHEAREKQDTSSVQCASTSTKPETTEMCRRDDAELISVKGPLAHGWYSVDEQPSTSSGSPDSANVNDTEHHNDDSVKRGSTTTEENNTTEERFAKSSAVLSPPKHAEHHSSPSTARLKHGVSPFSSPKRKDYGSRASPREYSSSPKRKSSEHHHHQQQQHLQINGTTGWYWYNCLEIAVLGSVLFPSKFSSIQISSESDFSISKRRVLSRAVC
ncbi:hypothetical protein ANCCEY_06077 [Ancylostoma ceylanicum]|uniref:Uncharacterized protein n=1 Tax=Ancylostoma ceylanicum TaxID=53326 RepID=A0A0D6LUK6_9BILA|nr:hypothetical protein ANCCEY_06077 [Ancylostoma ceylanicum]